jgi:hypothetical protein
MTEPVSAMEHEYIVQRFKRKLYLEMEVASEQEKIQIRATIYLQMPLLYVFFFFPSIVVQYFYH